MPTERISCVPRSLNILFVDFFRIFIITSAPFHDKLIVQSDVGIPPVRFVPRRFAVCGLRVWKPSRMDRSGDRSQEAQTILQVPDARTGKGVSLQCVRFEAKALGVSTKPESDRKASQDLVSESTHEKQEEFATAGGSSAKQQQQCECEQSQPQQSQRSPRQWAPPRAPRPGAAFGGAQCGQQAVAVTRVLSRAARGRGGLAPSSTLSAATSTGLAVAVARHPFCRSFCRPGATVRTLCHARTRTLLCT